jgi:NAD(P)-dependent dehydrogenase (short-subunit alcohol dehydrogenase family)
MLTGKVVIVCGGSGLLGKEFCRAIVRKNGTAIIADIDEKASGEVCRLIKNELQTRQVDFVKLDITSKESISQMVEIVVGKNHRIDALVNCAYPRNKKYGRIFEEVNYDDFCENVNLHLGGYFLVSQQLAKYFETQGYGNIVNVSSIYGVMAPRFEIYEGTGMTMPVEYAVIKSALIHLTKYMAKYYKGKNIRVNCLSPGGILRDQPPRFIEQYNCSGLSKGMLDAGDLCGSLVFLLSGDSRYINGQNIVVDDGFTL